MKKMMWSLQFMAISITMLALSGCGLPFYSDANNPMIVGPFGPGAIWDKPFSLASVNSTRRVVIAGKSGETSGILYCSEGAPTAGENIASAIAGSVAGSLPNVGKIGIEGVNQLATAVQVLTKSTQGLVFYKIAASETCQAYMNNAIGKEQYIAQLIEIRRDAKEIIIKEFDSGFNQPDFSPLALVISTLPENQRKSALESLMGNIFGEKSSEDDGAPPTLTPTS